VARKPKAAAAAPAPRSRKRGSSAPGAAAAGRARVRMYRHGLGDCILVFLKRKKAGAPDYRILIDCGVILGTPGAADLMTKVVDDVVEAVRDPDGVPRIDLLVLTHEHWDHLSGLIQARDSFAKIKFGAVWVAWTEDPNDPLAAELRGERSQAMALLQRCAMALSAAGATERAEVVSDFLGFFGAAGAGTTADAFKFGKNLAPLRFCRPSDPPTDLGDPDARIYVLGPPADPKLIRRTLPSKSSPETYGLALDGRGAISLEAVHALTPDGDPSRPFAEQYEISLEAARGVEFFHDFYFSGDGDGAAWRSISGDWLDGAGELALALDSATNNTSLVLAIELGGGDVLLFAADAQVGNWESWQNVKWDAGGAAQTGPGLLARTVFYKVGHHGSHNATLRAQGLELMTALRTAAIPVDHEMALKKRWGQMPLEALTLALDKATGGRVLRSDINLAAPLPGVTEQALYFDIEI
jgi:hypothetical protein